MREVEKQALRKKKLHHLPRHQDAETQPQVLLEILRVDIGFGAYRGVLSPWLHLCTNVSPLKDWAEWLGRPAPITSFSTAGGHDSLKPQNQPEVNRNPIQPYLGGSWVVRSRVILR